MSGDETGQNPSQEAEFEFGKQTRQFFGAFFFSGFSTCLNHPCERLRADELGQEMAKWFGPLSLYQPKRKKGTETS